MRPSYRSVTPAVVRSVATEHLAAAFDWTPRPAVSVDQMLRLLLLMATGLTSLFDIARRLFPFRHESARRTAYANCPPLDHVADGLNRALHRILDCSRLDRTARWTLALDTHFVPYYGQRTPAVVGGPRKAGTKLFFATATLLTPGRRYTLAGSGPQWARVRARPGGRLATCTAPASGSRPRIVRRTRLGP